MSNYKAVAVVTAALRNRLSTVCDAAVSGASVTTLRPDTTAAGLPSVGVNIFLFQVTPNAAQRNLDLPTRRADGSLIQHPVAAIDLHLLLSFYGNDANFETQLLLGSVISNLHAQPSLSRSELAQVFSASALGLTGATGTTTQGDQTISELTVSNQAALVDPSGLADAVDLVRFTPTALSLEELSKLWSVFLDTPYVLSVIYQAGPVLIEDRSEPLNSAPLPVMLPARIHALAGSQVAISSVFPAAGPGQPIVASSTLTIVGPFVNGASTRVLIDGAPATTLTYSAQQGLTGIALPTTLTSGAHSLQVTQQLPTGSTTHPLQASYSNVAVFILQPTITGTPTVAAGSATRTVTVIVAPPVAAHQTVRLLLNLTSGSSTNPPTSGAYVLEIAAPSADGVTSFDFPTRGQPGGDVAAGTYLVRIQIDGIESPLIFVAPPAAGAASGPTGFTAPTVTLA